MVMRYKAIDKAEHRCCYEAKVVDLNQPDGYGGYIRICECFDLKTAEIIADALNVVNADIPIDVD